MSYGIGPYGVSGYGAKNDYAGGINQTSRLDNANTFYAGSVLAGAVALNQSQRFDGASQFYPATVTQGGALQSLTQSTRFDSANTLYLAAVSPGAIDINQSVRLDNGNQFYSSTITATGGLVQSTRFDNVGQFFAATVTTGVIAIQSPLVTNTSAFFAHTVSLISGPQSLAQSSRFDNSNTHYSATVSGAGGMTLTPEDISAVADAVWSHMIEGGFRADEMLRVMFSSLAGKREGFGTGTERYYDVSGTKPRVTFTPDSYGNGTPTVDGSL